MGSGCGWLPENIKSFDPGADSQSTQALAGQRTPFSLIRRFMLAANLGSDKAGTVTSLQVVSSLGLILSGSPLRLTPRGFRL